MRLTVTQLILLYIFIQYFILLQYVIKGQRTIKKNDILSRKKRWLTFPEGSNFAGRPKLPNIIINVLISFEDLVNCTVSSLKEVLLKNPHGYRTAYECDALFKLPNKIPRRKKIPMHYRQRRELHRGFSNILDMSGFDGDACMKRIICEVKAESPFKYSKMLRKILSLIFIDPSTQHDDDDGCSDSKYIYKCDFSLLNFVMSNIVTGTYN